MGGIALRRSAVAAALSVLLVFSSAPSAQSSTAANGGGTSPAPGSAGSVAGEAVVLPQAPPPPPPSPAPIDSITLPLKAGAGGTITSADRKIAVTLPKEAVAEDLRVEYKAYKAPGGRSGMLRRFTLNAYATARADAKVATFPANVTIAYKYTDADLAGLDVRSLGLFYLDEKTKAWVLVPSQHDQKARTLTSSVGHFSTFSQQANPLDSGPGQIMAFTNDLHSGTAVARYPLDLPPGPGGFKPKLELVYNSGVADETKNRRDVASWLGLGWSLHLGRIIHPEGSDKYTLDMPDGSYELLQYGGGWRTKPDSFWNITSVGSPPESSTSWTAIAPDGTRYTVGGTDDSRQSTGMPNTYWRWDVNSITDVHGNQISVTYYQDTRGSVQRAAFPQDIWYDGPLGSARINVHFNMSAGAYNDYDGDIRPDNPYTKHLNAWCYSEAPKYMETRKLDSVEARIDGTLVRKYDLTYATTNAYLSSDYYCSYPPPGYYVPYAGNLTLTSVTQQAPGGSALPSTTFGYANKATSYRGYWDEYLGCYGPAFSWPHLVVVNNGYGGSVSFTYTEAADCDAWSREVVARKDITPGTGIGITQSYWYAYTGVPIYYGSGWYASYRGFGQVRETDASGAYSDHWYYTTGTINGKDAEKLTSKEYQTEWRSSTNSLLRSATYDWNWTATTPSTNYFVHLDTAAETVGNKTKRTRYAYDSHSNVTTEYRDGDTAGTWDDSVLTQEFHPNTAAWIVNKPALQRVSASGATKAESFFYYDGATSYTSPPSGGNLTRVQQAVTSGSYVNRYYTYDSKGNKASETDPNGNVTTYTYDPRGIFLTGKTYPQIGGVGWSESYTWDPAGIPLSETDVNGQTTTYEYDAFKRLIKVIKPGDSSASPTIEHQYLNWGTLFQQRVKTTTKTSGSNSLWRSQLFDGLGRVVQTQAQGEAGRTIIESTRSYDAQGRPDKEYVAQDLDSATVNGYKAPEAAWKYTAYGYDALGRVTSTTRPDGTSVTHDYAQPWGDLVTGERGCQKRYYQDAFARLSRIDECNASTGQPYYTWLYQYDVLGNLTSYSGSGNISYDMLSRKTSMTDPDMGAWSYVYDSNGNLTSQTDAKTQTITFTYDSLNRPITKTGSGLSVGYTYDSTSGGNVGKGRRTGMSDGTGATAYTYDNRGRVTSETKTIDGNAFATLYAYDGADRLTQVTYPGNETVTTAYNLRGLPQSLTSNLSGSLASGALYNALGLPTQVDLGNGLRTTYGYWNLGAAADKYTNGTESYGRLWEAKTFVTATPAVVRQDLQHTWDATGNLTQRQDVPASTTEAFGYDFLDRLTGVSGAYSETYAYDVLGNITSKGGLAYTYGAKPHAVTQVGGTAYTYDNNGNMTARGAQALAWDAENRLTSVSQAGSTTASFTYDGEGQRVLKRETDPSTGSGQATLYVNKYYEQRLPAGLVGRWKLDEGSGTTAGDSSGMGNAGTVYGSPSSPWPSGKSGTALQLDGVDDYVDVGSPASLNITGNQVTVEAWGKWAAPQSGYPGIVDKLYGGAYALKASGNIPYFYVIAGGVEGRTEYTGTPGADLAWHHIVGTYDGTNMRLYVDGALVNTQAHPAGGNITSTTAPLHVGKRPYVGQFFNGAIDEVRIYSRALSATDVAARYLDTSAGPVGQWRLEEGIGTVAHDTSGQGNTASLLPQPNGPAWVSGKYGSGLQFDGGNDYVTAGNGASLNITGALTVEYWMKPTSLQETGGVNKYDLNNQRSWTVFPRSDGAIIWRVSSDGTANTLVDAATTAQQYSAGVWSHVVATYTPSTAMKVYVNGVESASLTSGVPAVLYAASTIPVYMGSYGQWNGAPQTLFNGVLDEVRIYNRALTASEVAARYQAQPEAQETLHYYLGGKEVAFKRGGTLYYVHQDHLGSSAVITNSSGAQVESMAYYPYGATRTGSIATTEEKFTGQRLDSTGLYFYNARYYDPNIGRFISPDSVLASLGNPQTQNRYSYVLNNPLRYTDPSGHWFESLFDIAMVAWDVYEVWQDPSLWNMGMLALDVGALALPVVPAAAGATGRAAKASKKVAQEASQEVAQKANPTKLLKLTYGNMRKNLLRYTGKTEQEVAGMEAHHVLPNALRREFNKIFKNMGQKEDMIDHPLFGAWWEKHAHKTKSYAHQKDWETILDDWKAAGYNPTLQELIDKGKALGSKHGFEYDGVLR